MFLLFKECGSSQETEEFTFYIRDEEGNVMSEFKSNFCPSEQRPFLSQNAFLAKENNFYFNGKIKATEKIEGYHNQTCPIWNFYHQDHLGNTRVITDDQGNVIAEHKYFPYGEELTSHTQDTLSHRFTGHERDFESNLDYMMARYYNSFMGRFLSPNIELKINLAMSYPTKFNRYQYSLCNPLKFVDLTGFVESLIESFRMLQHMGIISKQKKYEDYSKGKSPRIKPAEHIDPPSAKDLLQNPRMSSLFGLNFVIGWANPAISEQSQNSWQQLQLVEGIFTVEGMRKGLSWESALSNAIVSIIGMSSKFNNGKGLTSEQAQSLIQGGLNNLSAEALEDFLNDLQKAAQSEGSNIKIKVSSDKLGLTTIEITDTKTGETTSLQVVVQ